MSRLEVQGLHKAFGETPVLRGLDLDVPTGALAAVLGPSGCGKTTLLRVLAGFEAVDAGSVRLGGRLVADARASVPPERRRVGVVPQEGALFPHLSVAANVAYGLPGGRRHAAARGERVEELLALLSLTGLGARMPADLSGGQQQRVALARALAPDPEIVLLDEPFTALDAGLRASVRADVRDALRATGATAVLVTHDQEEALSTADVVAVMRDGVVVQSGTPQQVYREPADLAVADFVGEVVVLSAQVHRDGVAQTPLGLLPLVRGTGAAGERGRVVVRPEQVRITSPRRGRAARVTGTVFYGHDASVRLQLGETTVLCRTQRLHPVGEEVGLLVAGPVTFFADAPVEGR